MARKKFTGTPPHSNAIILFDGVCVACSWSVHFILEHETQELFQFAALQTKFGRDLLRRGSLPMELATLVLADGPFLYTESDAVLRIGLHLKGFNLLSRVALVIPAPVRNLVYRCIAKNRYRLFGKQKSCMVPPPELSHRFLD